MPQLGGNPLSLQSLYMLKNVQEGSYLRIHYRLIEAEPLNGVDRVDWNASVLWKVGVVMGRDALATTRVCCTVRGSVDHVPEERVYYGGGSYDP